MALKSKFAQNDKLRDCENNDIDHVGENFAPSGPHVGLIQEALNTWAGKQNPPVKPITGAEAAAPFTFGKDTGDLVAIFKSRQTPPILNFNKQIDRIVGKKTVVALDKELIPVPQPPAPPAADTKIIDIILKFQGTLADVRPLLENEVFPDTLLTTYNTKTNRIVKRLGFKTNTIREKSTGLIEAHVKAIKELLKAGTTGKIFIYGSSSGGRNAIDLAIRLTQPPDRLPLGYVGILDAAFFPNETKSTPDNFSTEQRTPPEFVVADITADKKENFFQTFGNHLEVRVGFPVRSNLFKSEMGGKEIHGTITGFSVENFTDQVKATNPQPIGTDTIDDTAHKTLTGIAQPVLQGRIKALMDAL